MKTGRSLLLATAALTAVVLAWVAGLTLAMWSQADAPLREALTALAAQRGAIVVLFVLLLPALLAALAWPWVHRWPCAIWGSKTIRGLENISIITKTRKIEIPKFIFFISYFSPFVLS